MKVVYLGFILIDNKWPEGFSCHSCPLLDHSSGHQIKISCPKFCTVQEKKENALGPLRKPFRVNYVDDLC
jgi:hypothetical protein